MLKLQDRDLWLAENLMVVFPELKESYTKEEVAKKSRIAIISHFEKYSEKVKLFSEQFMKKDVFFVSLFSEIEKTVKIPGELFHKLIYFISILDYDEIQFLSTDNEKYRLIWDSFDKIWILEKV